MKFPTLLAIFIIFIIWFAYKRKKGERMSAGRRQSFWDKESDANSVRKKSLDTLDYITIPIKNLPFLEINDENLNKYYGGLTHLAARKIVNLTGITNTELKLEYGAPNITLLSEYDENYTSLVRTLNLYASRLYELGFVNEASQVLEYAVQIHTDVSETYRLLAKIYIQTGRPEKINDLIGAAETINSLSKSGILKHLNSLKD